MSPASEPTDLGERNERVEQLYRQYYRPAVRALRRWGSAPEDAEDLAHDTFVWILERGTDTWPKRRPRKWVLAAARRQHHRFQREREAFRRNVLGEVDEDWQTSESSWPSLTELESEAPTLHATRLIPRVLVEGLRNSLQMLPAGPRRALRLEMQKRLEAMASRIGTERLRFESGELWAVSEWPELEPAEPAIQVLPDSPPQPPSLGPEEHPESEGEWLADPTPLPALAEPEDFLAPDLDWLDAPSPSPPALPDPQGSYRVPGVDQPVVRTELRRVEIFFATNRERLAEKLSTRRHFGGRRGKLTFGRCEVSIPRDHKIGELEEPSFLHFGLQWNPSKHVTLLSISPFSQDEWLQYLAQATPTEAPEALLFVHGYNVGFRDAVRRTAQMKFDLKFPGPAIAFSWPSKAKLGLYTHDEQDAEWTIPDLAYVLSLLAAQDGIHRVHLIAHSMGTRCLTRGLAQLVDPALRAKFQEIILAAPDIDADIFRREILPRLGHEQTRITLYASSKDTALKASKKVHGYQRAGDSTPEILTAPNLDSIDASALPGDLLGHSYFAGSRSVLTDIHDLLTNRAPPARRFALEPRATGTGQRYWWFRP